MYIFVTFPGMCLNAWGVLTLPFKRLVNSGNVNHSNISRSLFLWLLFWLPTT